MAYLTVNSTFNPYTFDELVKPFVMYDTAYQQEVARTNELLEKAAALEDLSPTLDKEAYDSYQNWKGQLKAISDQIAETGLDINTRRAITGLGNTYRTDYLPYTEKLKTRGALIKEQREYLQKHPNAFFDIDYSATPVGDISTASSYNTYDLDDITTKVMTDAYGKLANGESVDASKYLEQYGAGLEDAGRLSQVAQAINSGISIASANQKQKEFENYIKEITAKRTYARSGGGGGSYSGGAGGGAGAYAIQLADGSTVNITYDKKTNTYQYKDREGKTHTTDKPTEAGIIDDINKTYFGGSYDRVTVPGLNVPIQRINGEDGYKVFSPYVGGAKGSWITLPNGKNTSIREFYQKYTGTTLSFPTNDELHYEDDRYSGMSDRNKNKLEKSTINFNEFGDYIEDDDFGPAIKKLITLQDLGLLQDASIDVYKKGDEIYKFDVNYTGKIGDWNAPIEQARFR